MSQPDATLGPLLRAERQPASAPDGELASEPSARRRPRPSAVGVASAAILGAIVLACAVGPLLWPVDPEATDVVRKFGPPGVSAPLGTDDFGRDILARLLHGGRLSLPGALVVVLGTCGLGLLVGGTCGVVGGRLDQVVSRVVDGLLSLPSLVVALAVVGAFGTSFPNLLLALIVTGWPWYARVYRGLVLQEISRDYVMAARALGAGSAGLLTRHVLPNVLGPIVVLATTSLGSAILSLTALSFLGLGVQPPTAEWGAMVNGARVHFQTHPWVIAAPGLAIALTAVAVSLLGDALRDRLDPRGANMR